ncbi:DUF952 domain-containing protein [Dichotomicrobium thermohalophilum]|uniref:Uncharacterized protein (DUF952 family) n=1 Tax=Dichotomicrobium thermohalophilum TaxID=933063 RepID=A0A397Q788_9HYPH|nr:DUF952 domain-containing protein [Dichotomicrobium thermohalophilum]RIA56843.1 uncharacterized protein (DUF952 family) [Dichotomicrobium thermohalophilum]
MSEIIYKLMKTYAWREAEAAGVYHGSADDERDGFIHFSTADQLPGTLAKHFAGQEGLTLVAVDAATLGDKLVWEPSRRGDLFPHLYDPLPTDAVLWTRSLPLNADGTHELPSDLPRRRGGATP